MTSMSTQREDVSFNVSLSSSDLTDTVTSRSLDIPTWLYVRLMGYVSYAMVVVSLFGMTGNVLIIATYSRIGFSESINISYCGLGISDFLCVTCITWNAICFIPAFSEWNVPFDPRKTAFGVFVDIFNLTTAMITAFISLERSMCVAFPFKVKRVVTTTRTLIVVITIFLVTVVPLFSFHFLVYKFELSFNTERNRSLLRVRYRNTPLADTIYNVYFFKKIVLNFFPLVLILLCSVFLAVRLRISAKWRLGNSGTARKRTLKTDSLDGTIDGRMYNKDMRIAKTVLTIAVAFIVLGNFNVVRHFVALILPEFRPAGAYSRWFRLTARLAFLLLQANSSVNFIIYYKMGTKFRKAVNQMFCEKSSNRPHAFMSEHK